MKGKGFVSKRFMGGWIKRQSHLDQKNSIMPLAKTFTGRWIYAYVCFSFAYRNECVLGQLVSMTYKGCCV